MVDETAAGEPVVEVRGARLVLRKHATFFNRLVPCSNCGRQTAGAAVRRLTDLDLRPSPATCRDCRRTAAGVAAPPPDVAPVPVEDTGGPRLDALEARIDELQAAVDAQVAKGRPTAGTQRLEALERRVEQVAALMAEREARLEQQLDEAGATAVASAAKVEDRVSAVEVRVDGAAREMADLGDLHAALDVGLGQLRTEIGAVRDGQRDLSILQDEFDRRLETVAAVQRAITAAEEGRGRRGGKRSAEFTTQLAAAQVATEELAKEQKQLRAQLSVIEVAADRAAETAGKAWAQVSVIAPLRTEVGALEERLEVQHEALAALTETVQSLLRSGPAKAPAAKKAPRPTKGAAPRRSGTGAA